MPAATQLLNVQQGSNEIALDLSATQTQHPRATPRSRHHQPLVVGVPDADEHGPGGVRRVVERDFQSAVRYGINYDALVQLGGDGAIQAPGLIP